MALLPGDLPSRFPVGTRYVVEGRGGGRGTLHIHLRYLEFPDGRHIELPEPTPLANVHLTILRKVGVEKEKFGDSTGVIAGV